MKLNDAVARLRVHSNGILIAAVLVGAVVMVATLAMRGGEKDVAIARANSVSSPIIDLCLAGDDTARILASARTPDGKSLCEAAADVKTDPVTAQVPNLNEARIRELIVAELAKRPNPAPTPDMAQVVAAARRVILDNAELFRGDPGQPPSPVEIAAVVSTFIRANPDMFRGRPGEDGKDGLMGKPGRPGDSFGGISGFRLSGGRCVAVVDIVTPTGRRQDTTPVAMGLCQEPTPATATVTATVTSTPTPTSTSAPVSTTESSVTPTPAPSLSSSEPPPGEG